MDPLLEISRTSTVLHEHQQIIGNTCHKNISNLSGKLTVFDIKNLIIFNWICENDYTYLVSSHVPERYHKVDN